MHIPYSAIYTKRARCIINGWMGIGIIFLLFLSCHTDDLDLQKLSTSNLKPKIYIPLAYGTYDIKTYLPSEITGSDNQIIDLSKIQLLPLTWRKGKFVLQPEALDSAYLEISVKNSSPMKTEFSLVFTDFDSGVAYGRNYSGEVAPAVTDSQPTTNKIVYLLSYNDLSNIKSMDGVACSVTLFQPDSGSAITLGSIRKSQFQIQVNFTSGLLIGKLK